MLNSPEPFEEFPRRIAIGFVVVPDQAKRGRRSPVITVPFLPPGVVVDHGIAGRGHLASSRRHVNVLDILERVGRLADQKALPDHCVQIHKYPAAKQFIHFGLAASVAGRQSLQGAGLVGGVMVNVHRWMFLTLRKDPAYEVPERFFFLIPIMRPPIQKSRAPGVQVDNTEKVFQPARNQRIAFDVEAHVSGRSGR